MRRRCLAAAALALFFLCAAASTRAQGWDIDYAKSRLGFTGMMGNATFKGHFGRFTVTADFDPAHPEKGKIAAIIDMKSASTGDSERDAALPQGDWFDAGHFPQARFVSTAISQTGTHSYEAQGQLTIKGITHPIVLPFTLIQNGEDWRIEGHATLIRNEFGVGEGRWSSDSIVAYEVDVTVDLTATPGK